MNIRLFFLCFLISLVASCSSQNGKTENNQEEDIMYTPSELAVLMHKSEASLQLAKSQIENGRIPTIADTSYRSIRMATPTEEHMKDSLFYAKAGLFVEAMDSLNKIIQIKNSALTFNMAVQACLNCHENSCGGPIPRIKKLFIITAKD